MQKFSQITTEPDSNVNHAQAKPLKVNTQAPVFFIGGGAIATLVPTPLPGSTTLQETGRKFVNTICRKSSVRHARGDALCCVATRCIMEFANWLIGQQRDA